MKTIAELELRKADISKVEEEYAIKHQQIAELEILWKQKDTQLNKQKLVFKNKIEEMRDFVRDSKLKVDKFGRKAAEDSKHVHILQAKIHELQHEVALLEQKKGILDHQIAMTEPYQIYLEDFCQEHGAFKDVEDIIKRYELLYSTSQELNDTMQDNKQQAEDYQSSLSKLQKESTTNVLELNASITTKQHLLEKLKQQVTELEDDGFSIKEARKRTNQELNTLHNGISNLVIRVKKEIKLPNSLLYSEEATKNPSVYEFKRSLYYLEQIQNRLQDLNAIVLQSTTSK